MPGEKSVEARHQTQHKLETMDRYWRTWCRILARASTRGFCNRRLWLIDTMAGRGLHESAGDPDGVVPGTPFQAVLAARATQAEFEGVVVGVRAIDIKPETASTLERLLAPYRGPPPNQMDIRVDPVDWVEAVAGIVDEIRRTHDHRHQQDLPQHDHRSLWFVDPYGLEGIHAKVIMRLPPGSEVIVNFDENGARRDAATKIRFGSRQLRGRSNRAGWTLTFSVAFAVVQGFVERPNRRLSRSA